MNKIVPDGWKRFSIKEIGTVVTGSTPPKKYPENYGGALPWIKPPDLDNEMFVFNSSETISEIGRRKIRLLPKGTVLISCIGNIGKIAIAGHELCTNQQINSIIPNEKIVDSVFLYFTIRRMQPYMQKIASKAVVPLLNKTDFSNIIVNLPPLPTQKKIVATLEKAEQLKGWRREADELTDELLKSTFLEMFGDPMKNSKGLEMKRLDEVASITMGQSPNGNSYNTKRDGMPLLNGPTEFGIKYPKEKQWTTEPKKNAGNGSILFCVRGATAGRMNWTDKEYCIGRGLASINSKSNIPNEFIYHILESKYTYFQNIGQGSTFINIAKDDISDLLIPISNQNKIDEFIDKAKKLEQIREHQKQSKKQVIDLFNVLVQKAFKGELVN